MNDKDEEIRKSNENLLSPDLESLEDPLYKILKDIEQEKFKKEHKRAGWLLNIVIITFFMALAAWLISNGSKEPLLIEDTKIEKQETTSSQTRNSLLKAIIVDNLTKQGFDSYWSQDTSLWIETPGYSSYELETLGYGLCDATKESGMSQKYIITFWQSLKNGPNGKITNVKCF